MVDSVGPSGVSPSEQAQNGKKIQESNSSSDDDGISFQDLLDQAKKAVDQGEKTKNLMGSASVSDQVELENILKESQQLEDLFQRLFQMLDELKQKEKNLSESAINQIDLEGVNDRIESGQQSESGE